MSRLFYVHWNEAECMGHVRALRADGHKVAYHWSTEIGAKPDPLPEAVVISLDRLPSHGRAVAEWFQEAKFRRAIPLIFVGGAEDKVKATRAKFPAARYCSREVLQTVLRSAAESSEGPPQKGKRVHPIFRGKGRLQR